MLKTETNLINTDLTSFYLYLLNLFFGYKNVFYLLNLLQFIFLRN